MNTRRIRLAAAGLAFAVMMSSGLSIAAISMSSLTAPASGGGTADPDITGNKNPQMVSIVSSHADAPIQVPASAQTDRVIADPKVSMTSNIEHRALSDSAASEHLEPDGITATMIPSAATDVSSSDFDAGGPYGGPGCFEGSCVIHFEITTSDPTLIFFRWDFNNDGIWDTPWNTDKSIDRTMRDNYYGLTIAEGWDGVSFTTRILTGYNLYPLKNYYWAFNGPSVLGWKFKAKASIDALALYFFNYYQIMPSLTIRIWDYPAGVQLGNCRPTTQQTFSWTRCTLGAPIRLVLAHEYIIEADNTNGMTSWLLFNNPSVPWDKVEYQNMWYDYSPGSMPVYDFGGGTRYVPMVDFKWQEFIVEPLTQRDSAELDARNVPPMPFNVTADPAAAYEGTPARFSAWFDDPGLEDEWEYRWSFDNDTWTPWKEVRRYVGGANVLLYHAMTGDIIEMKKKIVSLCGSFCLSVDDYDFGPLGHNAHMTLDQLMAYDVLWVETNWGYIPDPEGAGDLLADYMDQKGNEGSGGVVIGNGPFIANSPWEFRGRYFSDGYSPIMKGGSSFGDWHLGTIYVPGHPILDGVATLTSYMHVDTKTVTAGATRIADWDSGRIAVATKPNPVVINGARSVAMPWSAWYGCKGHCIQAVVNALRWASRQPNPAPLTMPLQLQWTSHTYGDDDPVTTSPRDNFTVALQVKDDDHLRVEGIETDVYSQNFSEGCDMTTFPPGWTSEPYYGWRCTYSSELNSNAAAYWYYYNDDNTSLLSSPTVDLGSYGFGKVGWRQLWWANYTGGSQDGYVEVSTDGGLTYPTLLKEFHHDQPGHEIAAYSVSIPDVSSQFKLRYRIDSHSDWAWIIDDVKIAGVQGRIEWGLGNASGAINVTNVEPSVVGGPSSDTAHVDVPYDFSGLSISDPALWQETEWFAYKFDFGDGTPAQWVLKGSLVPPKRDILIIHSLCVAGDSCSEFKHLSDILNGLDLVGSVTGYNFFARLSAPTLEYMMNFDVIMFATNWGYIDYPPYEIARIIIGNNMASYLDQHAGGVVTWMLTYDLSSSFGDSFGLKGRYIDQDYGPFEKGTYLTGDAYFPPTINDPGHPVMAGLDPGETELVQSSLVHSGNLATTPGGQRLASWNDGGAAVGVKDFGNDGRRSCAINAYAGGYGGPSASLLLRNCIGWVVGGLPSPEIPTVTHTWASPGTYTVDISIIDDDMGWTWDSLNGIPVADPSYPQTIAHRYIQIDVQS